MLLVIVIWKLDWFISIFFITFSAFIIFFIAVLDSLALSLTFLISSCFSNHSFDLFASNRTLISASIVSFSSCFQITLSAVCLSYNQNRVISCYQSLLSDIWHVELFQTIKFCLVIIIMMLYELCIVISETLMMLMHSDNFEHSWECVIILFWIHAEIILLLWSVTVILKKIMWKKRWDERNSEMKEIVR